MTNEQMRVKIAESLGYDIGWGEMLTIEPDSDGDPSIVDHRPIPNYPEDLNACHAMEETLRGSVLRSYGRCLATVKGDHAADYDWHTTARQRCEAFLRVKGLYDQ